MLEEIFVIFLQKKKMAKFSWMIKIADTSFDAFLSTYIYLR